MSSQETTRDSGAVLTPGDEELPPSELGTKDFWEKCYDDELTNFRDHGDSGENWFGEAITRKVIAWLCDHFPQRDIPLLDVGCGNGVILTRLRAKGFTNLLGIDYSENSVQLAISVAKADGVHDVRFEAFNVLTDREAICKLIDGQFKVVFDKGTYDAICLTPDADIAELRRQYYESVKQFLVDDGTFLITSCNWTRDELLKHFAFEGSVFSLKDEIITPSLSFGGKTGNQVTSLIFNKDKLNNN